MGLVTFCGKTCITVSISFGKNAGGLRVSFSNNSSLLFFSNVYKYKLRTKLQTYTSVNISSKPLFNIQIYIYIKEQIFLNRLSCLFQLCHNELEIYLSESTTPFLSFFFLFCKSCDKKIFLPFYAFHIRITTFWE